MKNHDYHSLCVHVFVHPVRGTAVAVRGAFRVEADFHGLARAERAIGARPVARGRLQQCLTELALPCGAVRYRLGPAGAAERGKGCHRSAKRPRPRPPRPMQIRTDHGRDVPITDLHLGLIMPLGRRWKSYSRSPTTTVWPALFPP